MAKKSIDKDAIAKYVYQRNEENYQNEQQRKENLRKQVVVNRSSREHSTLNNVATHSRMPASYFAMRWVNSDRTMRNAAISGVKPPIITSSGRTFTC